jgi:hypothetical protein
MSWTKLFSEILTSSIWQEPYPTRLVWITMLADKDKDGVVHASKGGLAHRANVTLDECLVALERLLGPDEDSRTKEHEGRRIEPVDGGWRVLNHAKYRAKESKASQPSDLPLGLEGHHPTLPTGQRYTLEFMAFWEAYPSKVGKDAAWRMWQKRKDRPPIGELLAAIEAQKGCDRWQNGYVPNPATWINQGRWQDEVAPVHSNRTPVKPITYSEDFETLWAIYPDAGKVEKFDAWEAWEGALPSISEQCGGDIRAWMKGAYQRIEGLKKSETWKKGFIPKLATWIQRGGWEV